MSMPDLLTGEEELRLAETIADFEKAISRLNPIVDAEDIASLQARIDLLAQTRDEEVPTPMLCITCNRPEDLPVRHCPVCGTELEEAGKFCAEDERPAYLPMENAV